MNHHLRRIVAIPAGGVELEAAYESPARPLGVVAFAHGSGSSRMSPRNRFVANELRRAGFATLLAGLLTQGEDEDYSRRFDIALLTERLGACVQWIAATPEAAELPLGLFGASTGAAAALELAAALGSRVNAVVSRGGRPDLASARALSRVTAPTLLIVGGNDPQVIEMNEAAWEELGCAKALRIVPGATHLFEEPGALEAVAALACDWFGKHLRAAPGEARAAGSGEKDAVGSR
ncbi:MAG: dienelactone hydrolase family protein [Usitatibacter sp.]